MGTDATKIKPSTGAATLRGNADSAQKSALGSDGKCTFCQRSGYPILPLRYAVKPGYVTNLGTSLQSLPQMEKFVAQALQGNRYTLRVLRQGFVHVYLGVKGHWQTYVVTEDGYLRLLKNPDDPDAKTERPLTEACKRDGHNIPASFINIPERYKKVWIGFSDIAWRKPVRDAFEAKPDARMQLVDCTKLATNPAAEKNAVELTDNCAGLHNVTEEYATDDAEYKQRLTYTAKVLSAEKTVEEKFLWESLHGNYPRAGQLAALGGHVKAYQQKTAKQFGTARKMAAIALFDPVGMVQELNAARLHFIQARQNYTDKVMRPLIVSKSILGLKDYFEKTALAVRTMDEKKKNQPDVQTETIGYTDPMLGVGGVGTTITTTRKERAKQDADAAWKKIAERYSEPNRAAFDKHYEAAMKLFYEQIEMQAHDWSLWAKDSAWTNHFKDYRTSFGSDYRRLVEVYALALAGGAGEDKYSQAVWQTWLTAKVGDPNTPIYPALFGNRKDIMDYLVPADGELNKGDKLYDTAKNLVASEEGEEVKKKVKEFIGTAKDSLSQVLLAISGSVGRLEARITAQAGVIAHRATQAALTLYNDVEPIFIKVQMTVREYQRLLSDLAFQVGGKVKKEVGSLVLAGAMSINNPRVRDALIEVTIWTFEKAATVKAMLDKAMKDGAAAVRSVARSVAVSSVIISHTVVQELGGLGRRIEMNMQQAKEFARDVMSKSLRIGGQLQEPLLAGGAIIFQAWAFKSSIKDIKEKLGAEGQEAQLSLLSAGLGVVAATTETIGALFKVVSKEALGKILIKVAGFIGAASGMVDSIQAAFAARRAGSHGDTDARNAYYAASLLFGLSAVVSGYAVAIGSSALLGPIGIALVLVGLGIAAIWYAMNAESSQAEMWADRCYFGVNRNEKGKWSDAEFPTEVAELNSIIAGLRVEVGPRSFITRKWGGLVDFDGHSDDNVRMKISFGMFDEKKSAYQWTWYAKHKKFGNVLLSSGKYGIAPWGLANVATRSLHNGDIKELPSIDLYQPTLAFDDKGNVAAAVQQGYASLNTGEFEETSLQINYWPDSEDPSCLTGVAVSEEL
ncbi:T6SS effector BTH_I2691 family protein [Herbaspirillum sp. YR522]|uniref:T6SS effector BTH_I2691 family protein n=1 Tax=Herbaspirillum sp. YR522 TaxID=1144342 RepID=UPI00026FA2ED|nr:T6SS effector BTH_I2691 family protein [Herbaspirillum sp. YR522]EJN00475.1 hypothetical protein PMI40_03544 [Herbaspirillum sp. YR522]